MDPLTKHRPPVLNTARSSNGNTSSPIDEVGFSQTQDCDSCVSSTDDVVTGLHELKRNQVMANQCQDPQTHQLNEIKKSLEDALELVVVEKHDAAGDAYSELVDRCFKMQGMDKNNPLFREAVFWLQTNRSDSDVFNMLVIAVESGDRPVAHFRLAQMYSSGCSVLISDLDAIKHYFEAARLGYERAVFSLISIANRTAVIEESDRAVMYIQILAEEENEIAKDFFNRPEKKEKYARDVADASHFERRPVKRKERCIIS